MWRRGVKMERHIKKLICKNSIHINNVLSKFCSLLCYSKFRLLCEFLCSTFSARNGFLFYFFPWITTRPLISFNVLDGKERGTKDNKQAARRILDR